MNILRGISRWLLAVAVVAMVAVWISASVLQATLLNRDTVKRWLTQSGVYDKALRSLIPLEAQSGIATKEDMQKAFDATFPPGYVKQQAETALDATYDWADGKKPTISFSIPVNEKRDEFLANLIKQIQPRIAALPACPTRIPPNTTTPTCVPQGMSAGDFTSSLIRLADEDPFLKQPVTQEAVATNTGNQVPQLSYLPASVQLTRQAAVILPVLILLAAAAYVILNDDKIRGLAIISRRVFFQGLIVVIGGVFMWVAGTNIDLTTAAQDSDPQQMAILSNILNPFIQIVLPDIGKVFTLVGGIVAAVGGGAWAAAFIIRRKYTKVTQFSPKVPKRAAPATPQQTAPSALPTPQTPPAQPPLSPPDGQKPPVPPRIIQ